MISQDRLQTADAKHARAANPNHSNGERRGLGALLHDLIALVELQGQLLVHDVHQLRTGAGPALLMLAAGVILAFATVPVFLIGMSWMVSSLTAWPVWLSTVIVAAVAGVVPAIVLLITGWRILQTRGAILGRSASELRRNTDWLKRRLKSAL